MTDEFEIEVDEFVEDAVLLRMSRAVAADLALALHRYNEYRIKDGINRDSGWHDVATALERTLADS